MTSVTLDKVLAGHFWAWLAGTAGTWMEERQLPVPPTPGRFRWPSSQHLCGVGGHVGPLFPLNDCRSRFWPFCMDGEKGDLPRPPSRHAVGRVTWIVIKVDKPRLFCNPPDGHPRATGGCLRSDKETIFTAEANREVRFQLSHWVAGKTPVSDPRTSGSQFSCLRVFRAVPGHPLTQIPFLFSTSVVLSE